MEPSSNGYEMVVDSMEDRRDVGNGAWITGNAGVNMGDNQEVARRVEWTKGVQDMEFNQEGTGKRKPNQAIKGKSIIKGCEAGNECYSEDRSIHGKWRFKCMVKEGSDDSHNKAYFKREKWAMETYLDNLRESPSQTDEEFRKQIWDYVIKKSVRRIEDQKWKKRKVCAIRDFPPGCGLVDIKENAGENTWMVEKEVQVGWIDPDEEFEYSDEESDEEDFILIMDKDTIEEA
ncbi:hypothetical protein L1987_16404 [Smallanthus sonchifolius]|uniref:Uncharacterized protein n=1 Tax=Smallanthus sonchifolius TaxID=185202 RepID=A0ACB9JAD1_9ASTR|nr:hypothetical protein L1987_16404 [Smallanthus sonchifolius]